MPFAAGGFIGGTPVFWLAKCRISGGSGTFRLSSSIRKCPLGEYATTPLNDADGRVATMIARLTPIRLSGSGPSRSTQSN